MTSVLSLVERSAFDEYGSQENLITPPEGGGAAWRFLLGAFLVEAICWGFPVASGVFSSYYQETPKFEGQELVSIIGTTAIGISSLASPFLVYLCAKCPGHRKDIIVLGVFCCVGSSIGAAFAETAGLLLLCQGIGWGLGSALCITPVLSLLVEWFDTRKGLAYGVMFAGSGATGAALPFAFSFLLERYGQKIVLIGWAVITAATLIPVAILIRGNFPLEYIPPVQKVQWGLLRTPLSAIFAAVVFLQGSVTFLPNNFLPSYGADAGLKPWQQAFLLSAYNLATVPGQPLFGWLADAYGPYLPSALGSILSAITVFLLWGYGRTFSVLLIFGFTYGIVTGGVTTLRARFATALASRCADPSQELMIFGVMRFLGGAGSFLGGLAVSPLLPTEDHGFNSSYAGGSWTRLILFIGAIFLVSGLGYFGRHFTS